MRLWLLRVLQKMLPAEGSLVFFCEAGDKFTKE